MGVRDFVDQYASLADEVGGRIGVAPNILLGQWGVETGWGKSVIPGTNNLGNIKSFNGEGTPATDNMTGSRDNYRTYGDASQFGNDFASLLERRYKGAIGAGTDAAAYAQALKAGGYAEDPAYVQKLVTAANMAKQSGANDDTRMTGKGDGFSNDYFVDGPQPGAKKSRAIISSDGFSNDYFLPDAAPAKPEETFMGAVGRGLGKTIPELKQTAYGSAAFLADVFGADGIKEWGLDKANQIETETKDLQSPNDSFSDAVLDGKGSFKLWAGNAAGYTVGQALLALGTGGVGAVAGKTLAKKGITELVKKDLATRLEQNLAAGMTEEAAKAAAETGSQELLKQSAIAARKLGAKVGVYGQTEMQEVGSVYRDRVEESQKTGEKIGAEELFKTFAWATAAAAVEGADKIFNAEKILQGTMGKTIARRAAVEVPLGGARGFGTEFSQTLMEQQGAGKPVDWKEAIDSGAIGVVGDAGAGAIGSLHSRTEKPAPTASDARTAQEAIDLPVTPVVTPDQLLALPSPAMPANNGVMVQGAEGVRPQTFGEVTAAEEARRQADEAAAQRSELGGGVQRIQSDTLDSIQRAGPILSANGQPFVTEKAALLSIKAKNIDAIPVRVDGGFGIQLKAPNATNVPAESRMQPAGRSGVPVGNQPNISSGGQRVSVGVNAQPIPGQPQAVASAGAADANVAPNTSAALTPESVPSSSSVPNEVAPTQPPIVGTEAKNGFFHGPKGERYRVGVSAAAGGAILLEVRYSHGTIGSFYVTTAGTLIDADGLNLATDKGKLWVPNEEQSAKVQEILRERSQLDRSDPRRKTLLDAIREIVTSAPTPATVQPTQQSALSDLKGEIGWAIRGGQMQRTPGADGTVNSETITRSKWVPKSEFWPGRPKQGGALNETQAAAALDKETAGQPLNAAERRFVEYARSFAAERETQSPNAPTQTEKTNKTDINEAEYDHYVQTGEPGFGWMGETADAVDSVAKLSDADLAILDAIDFRKTTDASPIEAVAGRDSQAQEVAPGTSEPDSGTGKAAASEEEDLANRQDAIREAWRKWFSDGDATIGDKNYASEFAQLVSSNKYFDEWSASDVAAGETILSDYLAARSKGFDSKALQEMASNEARARASAPPANPAESAFNKNPERALSELSDTELDAVGKAVGAKRKKDGSRDGFIERIGATSEVRSAYLSVVGNRQASPLEAAAKALESAASAVRASIPQEPKKASENDFLTELFGQPSNQPAEKNQPPKNKQREVSDIRTAIRSAIDAAVSERDDWSSRDYKANKKQIELRGDGPSNQAAMSVGSINESRRDKAIESLNQEIAALEKLEQQVSTDDGAARTLASMTEIMDTAKRSHDSGNYPGSTVNGLFEALLLDRLNFRGPGGQGSITSNNLSKAVLSAIAPQDRPTLDLTSQTESQIKADEAKKSRDAAEKSAKDNAPSPENFGLVGSDRAADVGAAAGQTPMFSRKSDGDVISPRQSSVLEGRMNGDTTDAKFLSNLLKSKTFTLEGLGGFDAPTQREVLHSVLTLGNDLKIVRSVVKLIPVDVVNILRGQNLSTDSIFRDEAVLKKLLSVDGDGSVSTAIDVANALVTAVARVATKSPPISAEPFVGSKERRGTTDAGNLNHLHGDILPINATGNNGQFSPDNADIRFNRETSTIPTSERYTADLIAAVKDTINVPVEAVATPRMAERVVGHPIPSDAKGFFYKGKVWLIDSNIVSRADAEFVLWHELNHAGLTKLYPRYGREYQSVINDLFARNQNLAQAAKEWRNSFGADAVQLSMKNGLTLEQATNRMKLLSMEEALSDLSGKNVEIRGWTQFVAKVQALLRSIGLNALADKIEGATQAEALQLIARARQAVTTDGFAYSGQVPAFVREDEVVNQRAYHGTPHKFDKFSLDKIGTGEGAQAYGHGLYFASKKEIAEHYRSSLASQRGFSYKGKSDLTRTEVQDLVNAEVGGKYLDGVTRGSGVADTVIDDMMVGTSRQAGQLPRQYKAGSERADLYEKLKGEIKHADPGALYQVDIPEDGEMLHWDKPLSEQPEAVKAALDGADVKNRSGQDLLALDPRGEEIVRSLGADEGASQYLRSLGIRGIKYLDGGSRTAGDGSYNYVVFDDKDVNVEAVFSRSATIGDVKRNRTPEQIQAFKNLGRTVQEPTLKERTQSLWKDAGKKLAQGIVDQFAPVKDLDKQAYGLMRLAKGASGAFETLLRGGKLKLTDGVYNFDETQKGGVVEKLLQPLQGEHHDFLWWIAANRAERLASEGKENLFTPQDIAALKSLADGKTSFDYTVQTGPNKGKTTRDRLQVYADSQRVFNEFNKNVLDMAEQSGLIDAASRKLWEHEFYVPFYRVADEDGGVRGMNIKSGVIRQQAFKELKGGKNALNSDLLDNTLMNWAHLLDASAKNRAAKATIDAAERLGIAATGDQETLKQMASSTKNKSGVVWFMDGGQKRYSLIDNTGDGPFLLTAINALEYAGMKNPVMNAMSTMKHALTVGVTASPFFKVRNLIRDSVQAIGTSELSLNPASNLAKGWALTDPKSDAYFRLLAGGGTIHFGTMYEGSEGKRVQALVEAGVEDSTILNDSNKVQQFYRKFIEPGVTAYNELGNRGEAINRAALYDQLVKQGMSHADASLQARDLMDFSMQGSFATIRFLTQVVPFFNARIQGLSKLGRAAKEDPAKFATVLGAAAVLSVGLLAAYGDDEDWKKREEWDRNNYWWFKFGGTAFRIPKPFEIGAIATLAERGFELAFDKEMTGERFRKQIVTLLGDNLSMNPIPQMVKPILDVYSNKDSFSGRPIETMGMERLKSEYRFNDRTSMAARGMSTAANSVTGLIGVDSPSPVQIDHMLRGYFGWLGSFVVGASDVLARPATGQPTHAAPDMWKEATGGMVSDLRDAPSRYVSQMYTQAKELEQAYGTFHALLKEGKVQEAQDFAADNRDKLAKYRSVEHIKQAEAKLNERMRMVERSNLDADTKRETLRSIQEQKNRLAMSLI